ncbi:hypothetical protein [Bacteroides acidifaciens]|uniref:hypothetical protein n=1 Tax=Bacteroides acidifaciens TaxID=85831 RepID=UPI0030152A3E
MNRIGKPSRRASSGSSARPYIDPEVLASLVAVVKCDGKSNNDPDRAIIKNLVDPDNPFVISNAAYKLNSGFGKYEEDFTNWSNTHSELTPFSIITTADYSRVFNHISLGKDIPAFTIEVVNKGSKIINYSYIDESGKRKAIGVSKSGKYRLPASYLTRYTGIEDITWVGFTVTGDGFCSITQIPSFQGALVTDGVDDLIVSQKTVQEMLGGSNEITVVSMIHQITSGQTMTRNNFISGFGKTNDKWIDNKVSNIGKTGIYGYSYKGTNLTTINNILGDKNDYTSNTSIDSSVSIGFSVSGYITNNGIIHSSSVAWYWTFIANRVLTTDEINQVIAYYNLDKYVKPDVYYDVKKQGLSNDTLDEDWYLKDFSGNGRDMQLYNYAKTPESGINEEGGLQSDGVTDFGKVENLPIYKDYTVVADYNRLIFPGYHGCVAVKGAFKFNRSSSANISSESFGTDNANIIVRDGNRQIRYQSKYVNNGNAIQAGTKLDDTIMEVSKNNLAFMSMALWSLLLFPYTLSEFLLERQLKRYKLGTLYPDMVELRPIIKSNVDIDKYLFVNKTTNKQLNIGDYFAITDTIEIQVYLTDRERQEITSLTINGKEFTPMFIDVRYLYNIENFGEVIGKKSPQKIDITIDEYIRYEDIVQPYPTIFRLTDVDNNKEYTYGDKLKIGNKVKIASVKNLLPELYSPVGTGIYNGDTVVSGNVITVEKTMTFGWSKPFIYLKSNEPNCIADPQRLRIPNSSYKILGYIPDISGHGNHLKINNSAYAGMSGANGYKYDWNTWTIVGGSNVERTDSLFTNKLAITTPTWGLLPPRNTVTGTFKIKVEGLKTGNIYWTYRESEETYKQFYIYNDGEYELPAPISESDGTGFIFNTGTNAGVIVRQIGQYEGSFCLDGVDDFITIPTLSHGTKQVLMKVNNQNMNGVLYDQRNNTGSPWHFAVYNTTEAYSVAYNARNTNGKTYIDGVLNTNITCQQLLNVTHNLTITNNGANVSNSRYPVIGSGYSTTANFSKMALYTLMIFDDISSEEEIKELNDIVGIEGGYVESPDYYWDAYGKSNTQADDIDNGIRNTSDSKRTIFDKSITGLTAIEQTNADGKVGRVYDRALSSRNFAFNEESGYGGWLGIVDLTKSFNESYVTNIWKRGGTFIKGKTSSSSAIGYALANWYDVTNHILKFKIKITGLTDNDTLYIRQYNVEPIISQQLFNGINDVTLDLSDSPNPTYRYINFNYSSLTNDVDFEFLYEYQNGILSDGVDDNLKNINMPVLTDYTWIMKRKRLNDKDGTSLCYKGNEKTNGAFLFEYREGGRMNTRNFGASTDVTFPDLISWQTKSSYNGQTTASGTSVDGNALHIFMGSNTYPYYTKAVFYKAMLYSKTIDMLSINMLKNLFAKDELIDVNNPIFKQNN